MDGSELKAFTETILDGLTLDDDFFYPHLNIAKTKLEEERLWQYLKKLNDSNSVASGNTYATGIDLPDDFALDYKVMLGLHAEFLPVSFEEQHIYRNSAHRYFINLATEKIHLLGNHQSDTLYFFYKRFTPDIDADSEPEFPSRFHGILGYMVAAYYQAGVDADDIFAQMSPVNRAAALELKNAMVAWDMSLALRAQNDRVGMESGNKGDVPLEMM